MNGWEWGALGLMIGGLLPALYLGSRQDALHRLVGLELASATSVLTTLVLSQAVNQPSYLIVPLVLVLLSFTGTLVFTRLLGPRP